MSETTSQPPMQGDWLDLFLREDDPDAAAICVRWYGESAQVVLTAFCKWSRPFYLSACSVRWQTAGEYCLLALLTAAPSPSPSTGETTAAEPTARALTSSLRRYARYATVQQVVVAKWGTPSLDILKEALRGL